MVGGSEVVFAAVGLLRPRIVVSTGAPARLDDDELAAGLAHEEGHVRRRHHHVLLYAEACRALSAWLPGTRRAVAELRFHLERDADDWALRSHDPLALASAICKAASPAEGTSPLAASLSGSAVLRRVDLLMEATNAGTRTRRGGLNVAAALMTCLVIASVIALPAQAVNRDGSGVPEHGVHHCND
jgi:beta-lactamase regulating signal transducer with metallopeptidase domain